MTDREFVKKAAEAKAKRKAARIAGRAMAEGLLNDPGVPEDIKIIIRVLEATKDVGDALHEALDARALAPGSVKVDNLRMWLFFLTIMKTQIEAFKDNIPILKNESGE